MDKLIADGVRVDMILTDPPYGSTNCSWDVIIPFEPMWEKIKALTTPKVPICLFGTEPYSSLLRCSNMNDFKYDWIWDKIKGTGFLNAKKQPMRYHEIVSVFYKEQCLYKPQKTYGHIRKQSYRAKNLQTDVYGAMGNDNYYDSTERYPRSIQEFSTDTQNSSLHPTQKPVAWLEYLIRTYTNEGDTVLDFTMGSCSTGIACLNTNRNFIGIEKEKKYYDISGERMDEANRYRQISLFDGN
jgi:site-specific DNA-methyltransferase (adenine-specific)